MDKDSLTADVKALQEKITDQYAREVFAAGQKRKAVDKGAWLSGKPIDTKFPQGPAFVVSGSNMSSCASLHDEEP